MGRESTKELPMYIHKYLPSFLTVPSDWIHVYILSYEYCVICSRISLIVHDLYFSHVYVFSIPVYRPLKKNTILSPAKSTTKSAVRAVRDVWRVGKDSLSFLCFKNLSMEYSTCPLMIDILVRKKSSGMFNLSHEPEITDCYIVASQPTPCKVPPWEIKP